MTSLPPVQLSDERMAEISVWAAGEEIECAEDAMPVSAQYYADVQTLLTELQHSRAAEAVAWIDRHVLEGLTAGECGTVYGAPQDQFSVGLFASPASPSATGVREALQEALKLSKLTESLCACRRPTLMGKTWPLAGGRQKVSGTVRQREG